jgi:hypothetical protein
MSGIDNEIRMLEALALVNEFGNNLRDTQNCRA